MAIKKKILLAHVTPGFELSYSLPLKNIYTYKLTYGL